MFLVNLGAFYYCGWPLGAAGACAYGMTVITDVALRVIEKWPNWRSNDASSIPIIIGSTLMGLGIKGLELA